MKDKDALESLLLHPGMWFDAVLRRTPNRLTRTEGGVRGLAMQGWTGWHCCARDVGWCWVPACAGMTEWCVDSPN